MITSSQLDLFGGTQTPRPEPAKTAARSAAQANHETRHRPWKTALGISVGDIVRTSYHTGPYEVWSIWGPRWWSSGYSAVYVYSAPVTSLRLVLPGKTPRNQDADFYYLNDICQVGERWITLGGDELFVEPGTRHAQAAMVPELTDELTPWTLPYPRIDGVDYDAGHGHIFTCVTGRGLGWPEGERCCDFNGQRGGQGRSWDPIHCPVCGRGECLDVVVMPVPQLRGGI